MYGEGLIGTLDVSNLTVLISLDCVHNDISTLDVSNLTALESLYCYGNKLANWM